MQFDPKYEPATGDIIDIFVLWRRREGGQAPGQGPGVDEERQDREGDGIRLGLRRQRLLEGRRNGKEHYQANGGDFICVSNFPTAMLDLPIESSQANAELMFHALTENIPPKGTKVRLVLIPRKKVAERK